MYRKGILLSLVVASIISVPAFSQTAIEQQRQDIISNVVQIQDELAIRNVQQTNTARVGQNGNFNEVEIIQDGARNTASVATVGNRNGLQSDGTSAVVQQNGRLNFAVTETRGDDNFFAIEQTGIENSAVLVQSGGNAVHGANKADIAQFQSGNVASVVQQSIYAGLFTGQSDNTFSVVQDGLNNSALGEQFGAANEGEIEQTGDGNFALLGQYGASNSSLISQTGVGLVAQSLQFGDFTAPIRITQTPGAPPVSITRSTQ